MSTITTFGDVDARSLEQLKRCMEAGDAAFGVLCADHHPGYSQPIGGGIAYEGYVSPSGVGYDIGCGNKAVQTALTETDLDAPRRRRVDHARDHPPDLVRHGRARARADRPRGAGADPDDGLQAPAQAGAAGRVAARHGRLGQPLRQPDGGRGGHVWVGVHFGSRGFGHKTASGFLALAQGLPFDGRAHEGEMDSPPVLFEVGSELGEAYIVAMQLAGDYAYAGRDIVVSKVLEILGAEAVHEVHNHHNFAWREEHFGRTYWVIRKGCTPACPGQEGFVGGSMGADSVILEGVESVENERRCTRPSTVPAA